MAITATIIITHWSVSINYSALTPCCLQVTVKDLFGTDVNNRGGRGNNIAHDLKVEHSNLYNKTSIKNLGPNVTEKALQQCLWQAILIKVSTAYTDLVNTPAAQLKVESTCK